MTATPYIGRPIYRVEDDALVQGSAFFVDDIHLPGMLEAAFVRSSFAHARLLAVDATAARAMPGVRAVLMLDDLRPLLTQDRLPLQFRLDKLPPDITPPVLAFDEVVHVGEPIAIVIAESRYLAEDAATAVEVEYEPLDVVANCRDAVRPGAPRVDTRQAGNVLVEFRQRFGAVEASFAAAPHRVAVSLKQHRGVAHPMEGRAVLASYDRVQDRLTVWDSTQQTHEVRGFLMFMLDRHESQIRVIAPEVGGGFGAKFLMYSEELVVAASSLLLDSPVKWIEDRREHFLSAIQERDQYWDVEAAFGDDGRLHGVRGTMLHDQGAYTPQGVNLPTNASIALPGPYVLPCYDLQVTVAETNMVPTAPVRGTGYPQANFAMERLLDGIAGTLDLDRAEVRRRNLIPPERMPYKTGLSSRSGSPIVYDTGDYPACFEAALAAIDYPGFAERQLVARAAGRHIGIGVSAGLKGTGRGPFETATVRIGRTGKISVFTGANAIGQGIKTALAQICADQFDVDPRSIHVVAGDTDAVQTGLGAFASRQTIMAGSAVHVAAVSVRQKALEVAGEMLETAVADLDLRNGRVEVKGVPGHGLSLRQIGETLAGVPGYNLPGAFKPGLEATESFMSKSLSYGMGSHAVEVEVDVETGHVTITRYVVVNDCGRIINPQIVRGQILGSVVHGIGNTLFEWMAYDDQAQPLTTSFAEYLIPTAPEIPRIEVILKEFPSGNNPLGVKGVGETGVVPAPGAIISAIEDAMRPFGVRIAEFPLSPARLFTLRQQAELAAR